MSRPPQTANERPQVGDARGVKKELVRKIESLDFPRKHGEQPAFHKERQRLPNARASADSSPGSERGRLPHTPANSSATTLHGEATRES
jgi:hypothetical protein